MKQVQFVFLVLRDCFLSEKGHCESKDDNHTLHNCIMCQLRRLYHHVSFKEIEIGFF